MKTNPLYVWPVTGAAAQVELLVAARSRDAQIGLLCDTRPLHRLLARLGSDERQPRGPTGRYRRCGEEVAVFGR